MELQMTEARVLCTSSKDSTLEYWRGIFINLENEVNFTPIEISENNLLPKGTFLRDTTFVVGAVVHLGSDTLISSDQNKPVNRPSAIKAKLFKYLRWLYGLIFIVSQCMAIGNTLFMSQNTKQVALYRIEESRSSVLHYCHMSLGHLILISQIIPSSIFVAFEIFRWIRMRMLKRDLMLDYRETFDFQSIKEKNNSNPLKIKLQRKDSVTVLNENSLENLGSIDLVLTDKTGTLTKDNRRVQNFYFAGQLLELYYIDSHKTSD